jgi:hypothetical protein
MKRESVKMTVEIAAGHLEAEKRSGKPAGDAVARAAL